MCHYVAIKSIIASTDGMNGVIECIRKDSSKPKARDTKRGRGGTLALQRWLEVGITKRERGPRGEALWAFCLVGNPPSKLSHFSIAFKGNAPVGCKTCTPYVWAHGHVIHLGHKGKTWLNLHLKFSNSQASGFQKNTCDKWVHSTH